MVRKTTTYDLYNPIRRRQFEGAGAARAELIDELLQDLNNAEGLRWLRFRSGRFRKGPGIEGPWVVL